MSKEIASWYQENIPPEVYQAQAFRFNVKLANGNTVEINIPVMTEVNYDTLEEDMADVPSQLSYFGVIHSELKYATAILDRRIKARRGILTEKALDYANAEKLKITDTQLKTVIEGDDVLNKLEEELAKAWKDAGKLYYLVETVKAKLEVTRSLAGFKRQELDQHRNNN